MTSTNNNIQEDEFRKTPFFAEMYIENLKLNLIELMEKGGGDLTG